MGAKRITGKIYKRGKEGRFYLRYKLNGESHNIALKDDEGNPITDERTAKAARDAIINPLNAGTKAQRLKHIVSQMKDAESVVDEAVMKAEEAEKDKLNDKATIEDGWSIFMTCKHRPKSCKRYSTDEMEERDGRRLKYRNTTAGNYAAYYKAFAEWLGEHHEDVTSLADVTPDIAEAFMAFIGKKYSDGTFNKYLQFLGTFYDVLIEDEKITCENPFKDVDRKKGEYYSKSELTAEQVADIIEHADGEMKVLLCIGYFTGLRLGDCCTLLWRECDMEGGMIRRTPRKTAYQVKDKSEKTLKLGIPPYLMRQLETLPKNGMYVLPEMARMYLNGQKDRISRRITAIFKSAGIETHLETSEDDTRAVVAYGFHSLRYSYVSLNAEAGTPQAMIQQNVGHKSKAMTQHYTKISDDAARKYASVLSLPGLDDETIEGEILCPKEIQPSSQVITDKLSMSDNRQIITNFIKTANEGELEELAKTVERMKNQRIQIEQE